MADARELRAAGLVERWDTETVPTVLRSGPYRVYFFSHEPNEPPHVHVDRDEQSAKFWLKPVGLALNLGFSPVELSADTTDIQGQRKQPDGEMECKFRKLSPESA
jgi:hypothetical protein